MIHALYSNLNLSLSTLPDINTNIKTIKTIRVHEIYIKSGYGETISEIHLNTGLGADISRRVHLNFSKLSKKHI